MKIYISEIKLSMIDSHILSKIEQYKQNEFTNHTFYTEEGIYKEIKNSLYEFYPTDEKPIRDKINQYNVIVDKSYWGKKNLQYQIPFDHYLESNQVINFKITPYSKLTLVMEFINNELADIYFSCQNYKNIDTNELDVFINVLVQN